MVAVTCNNLGTVYEGCLCFSLLVTLKDVGRLQDALPLLVRALEIFKKTMGEESPHVTSMMNNVGNGGEPDRGKELRVTEGDDRGLQS